MTKSIVREGREIRLAIELIGLGARLQVLEAETALSRDRLTKLYKEVRRKSPPKGMLPFSADWFITWQPNIHSSLFASIHEALTEQYGDQGIGALVRAYRLYLEHPIVAQTPELLSFTRAWTLLRYVDSGLLTLAPCTECGGRFVVHAHDPVGSYVCGLCRPPARAGKRAATREQPRSALRRPGAAFRPFGAASFGL